MRSAAVRIARSHKAQVSLDFVNSCLDRGEHHALITEFFTHGVAPSTEVANRCGEVAFQYGDFIAAAVMFTFSQNAAGMQKCSEPLLRSGKMAVVKRAGSALKSLANC